MLFRCFAFLVLASASWTDPFRNLDNWYFTRGNGSPNPLNMVDETPNKPGVEAEHMPGWGNMELQNYDKESAKTGSDGLKITASVRGVTFQELETGADYLLHIQSLAGSSIRWEHADGSGSYASPTSEIGFPKKCADPVSCMSMFVHIGCVNGDLNKCRIAFVYDSWVKSWVLSTAAGNTSTRSSVNSDNNTGSLVQTEVFDGNLSSAATWQLERDGQVWTIRSSSGCYLITATDPNDVEANVLRCAAAKRGAVSKAGQWNLEGVFSSRILSKHNVRLPYSVSGWMKVPAGKGTWPTFWLLPSDLTNGIWPYSGEIDIFDHVANDGEEMRQVVHVKDFHGGNPKESITNITGNTHRFVKYSLVATSDALRFSIDGNETLVYHNKGETGGANWPFDSDFQLLINLAVGGNWGAEKGMDFTALQRPETATLEVLNVTVLTGKDVTDEVAKGRMLRGR